MAGLTYRSESQVIQIANGQKTKYVEFIHGGLVEADHQIAVVVRLGRTHVVLAEDDRAVGCTTAHFRTVRRQPGNIEVSQFAHGCEDVTERKHALTTEAGDLDAAFFIECRNHPLRVPLLPDRAIL